MTKEYEDRFKVMDSDFKDSSILENLKGWAKDGKDPVGEMDVYVEMDIDTEDNSFSYPGFGGGTHVQIDVVAKVTKVYLIDSEGNVLDENIVDLLKDDSLEKMEAVAQDETPAEDLSSEREYEPDDF